MDNDEKKHSNAPPESDKRSDASELPTHGNDSSEGSVMEDLLDAEAYKAEQISRATGDTEKFLSMLAEYQNNSAIYTEDTTKYRLLLETLEKILPTVKLYIVDSSDGSVDVQLFDPSLAGGMNITTGN